MRQHISATAKKHRYAYAIGHSRTPYNPRALNLGLELLCNAFPIGALVLDSDHGIVFANREGAELLAQWTNPRMPTKAQVAVVPSEIAIACDGLRRGRSPGATPQGRPHFGGRAFVPHPSNPDLSAVVALERSPRDRRLALFCVFLHDRLRENLVSGRRDHLAMLTVAERRVAKLVVQGLRNREIAVSLGKSITTVKSQLAAVYGKLQVSSRMQLASLLRSV